MLKNGDTLWNVDESAPDTTFGNGVKVFGASDTRHGGLRKARKTAGTGKTLKPVVVVSASGKIAPSVFIVTRKHVMSNRFLFQMYTK